MKKKLFIVLTIMLFLISCKGSYKVTTEGKKVYPYDLIVRGETCIEGVTYILLDRGITVKLDTDSKIVRCNKEDFK